MKRATFIMMAIFILASCGNGTGKKSKSTTEAQESAPSSTKSTATPVKKDTATVYYFSGDTSEDAIHRICDNMLPQSKTIAVKTSTEEWDSKEWVPKWLATCLGGRIVESCSPVKGKRASASALKATLEGMGFDNVDILDADGSVSLKLSDTTHLKEVKVGNHINNYDYLINMSRFVQSEKFGYCGVLLNQGLGMLSAEGKQDLRNLKDDTKSFYEAVATSAKAVHNHFKGNVLYLDMILDLPAVCDGDESFSIRQVGFMASKDPVALEQACMDLVRGLEPTGNGNNKDFVAKVDAKHAGYLIDYAHKIGLGSKQYKLVKVTE